MELLHSLHSKAWFCYGDGHETAYTSRGSRQGCKHGPILFNSGYAHRLKAVRADLARMRLLPVVRRTSQAVFWARPCGQLLTETGGVQAGNEHDVCEVTYMDDEAIHVACGTPFKLWQAIPRIIRSLVEAFRLVGMVVNFKPGKTEGMVHLCGKDAASFKRKVSRCGGAIEVDVGMGEFR